MQTTTTHSIGPDAVPEERRRYRVERRFLSPRRFDEFVRDLLRAHIGE